MPDCLSDELLRAWLNDDCPWGDATTSGLGIGEPLGRLTFVARQAMVVCGSEEARRLGEMQGLRCVGACRPSSESLAAGDRILCLEGPAPALHRVWKTAQTLMEYLSGIASATRALVEVARQINPDVGVAATRKHFPGAKAASLKAVLAGGGSIHRLGLSDMPMNWLALAGDCRQSERLAKKLFRKCLSDDIHGRNPALDCAA